MAYQDVMASLDSSLYCYWPFDEKSGSIAYDKMGRYNGTLNGAETNWGSAIAEPGTSSYRFLQSNSAYVHIGNAMRFENRRSYTIAMWIYNTPTGLAFPTFFSKCQYGVGGYEFYVTNSTKKLSWARVSSSGSAVYHYSNHVVATNWWTHVAFRYNGTTMQIFVDGQPDASKTDTANCGLSSTPLRIGCYAGGGEYFNGHIDEVMVFTTALDNSTIEYIYEASKRKFIPSFNAQFM